MAQILLPNSLRRTLKVCLVLIGIGTFAVIVMGVSLINSDLENKKITKFLEIAKNARENFENSLVIYTEKTRNIINYLMKLRPESDEDVINFISEIEKIGRDLSLNVTLETYKEPGISADDNKKQETPTIVYRISFFGSITELNGFLDAVEALPYFTKVDNINFKDLNFTERTEKTPPNINLTIKFYIKENAVKRI